MYTQKSMSQNDPSVAKEILNQIKSLSPWALMSWGYTQGTYSNNSISFKVNGKKVGHAYVKISLNHMDTYDIEVFKFRKSGFDMIKKELGTSKDIYCDQLVEILDNLIDGKGF